MTDKFDLAVIGAGPGGYVAAFRAADLGLKVALVSNETVPGGVCLLRGCIPSKALLHVAHLLNETRDAEKIGLRFSEPEIDLDRIRSWKDSVIKKITAGLQQLCKKRKIEYIRAHARLEDPRTLHLRKVEGADEAPPHQISFEKAVVATGSRPAVPKALKSSDPRVMNSSEALEIPDIPERLLVVGGGYIGLELGQVYAALGSKVTLVELTDGLLPGTDRKLVRPLQKRLRNQFEAIHLETEAASLESADEGIRAVLRGKDGESEETFQRVLIAVGRRPNSENLGLSDAGVGTDDRGFISVDDQMRTSQENIFAIGDVSGGLMLAHTASYEGKVAAEAAAGEKTVYDAVAVPAVVFSDPEIAYCGVTETSAALNAQEIKVARVPWSGSGRALTIDQTEGLTQLILDPETHRILGVGMVGNGAGELLSEGVVAVEMAAVAEDLAGMIHTHPTLSETFVEAAESFLGRAIHSIRR